MKCHHRFNELEQIGSQSSLFIAISIVSNIATAHQHIMRSLVRVPYDLAVPAGDVADEQQRSSRIADNRVKCHVAVNAHKIQFAVPVDCRRRNEIGVFRCNQLFDEN